MNSIVQYIIFYFRITPGYPIIKPIVTIGLLIIFNQYRILFLYFYNKLEKHGKITQAIA